MKNIINKDTYIGLLYATQYCILIETRYPAIWVHNRFEMIDHLILSLGVPIQDGSLSCLFSPVRMQIWIQISFRCPNCFSSCFEGQSEVPKTVLLWIHLHAYLPKEYRSLYPYWGKVQSLWTKILERMSDNFWYISMCFMLLPHLVLLTIQFAQLFF